MHLSWSEYLQSRCTYMNRSRTQPRTHSIPGAVRRCRRNAFKFAPSCFELTDMDGAACIYHTASTRSSSGQLLVRPPTSSEHEWRRTDQWRSNEPHPRPTRVSFSQLSSSRRLGTKRRRLIYTRHHVINPLDVVAAFHTVLIRSSATQTLHGKFPTW